jgi:hypothetical protein
MGKIIIQVKISELKDRFGIRSIINHEHELYLWSLIEGGVPLPPIKITKDYYIIDGRHRIEAYKDANIEIIEAEVINEDSTIEIVKLALSSNIGGPLPPTKNDICRTMILLVEKKYSRKRIFDEFSKILPKSLIRTSYHSAVWKINNNKKNDVFDLLAKGSTLPVISKALDIPKEKIHEWIKNRKVSTNGTGRMEIRQMFTHFNKKLGKVFSNILQACEDGEKTKMETESIIQFLSKLISNQNRMYSDWNKRWNYKK